MHAEVWMLTRATFTGAAILLREKAAYRNTSFELAAARCRSILPRTALREGVHAGATRSLGTRPRVAFPGKDRNEGKETTWNHRQAKTWSR
jgi:hypothetical protein